jgi:hypothetical protein
MQVLTKETPMISTKKMMLSVVVAGLFATGFMMRTAFAASQTAGAAPQSANNAATADTPDPQRVVAGEIEARKLVFLMDEDKNGKVSRAEFMKFMAAEFDRLDANKDGELDVKELEKSQLMTVRHGGGHR